MYDFKLLECVMVLKIPDYFNSNIIVPVLYMDTLRKMNFLHPRIHVIGLQKCNQLLQLATL